MKKRNDNEYCEAEVMAELVLCRHVLGIPFQPDETGVAHIYIGRERVGVVVVPGDDPMDLDLEQMCDLRADIIVFAVVDVGARIVNLLGWLAKLPIREIWVKRARPRKVLPIDLGYLETMETLRKLTEQHC